MGERYRPAHREERARPAWRANPKRALRIGAGLLLALCLAFSATPWGRAFWNQLFLQSGFGGTPADLPPLQIHVLDVGKADAILLQCQGRYGLLDAGAADSGDKVVDYLSRHGVTSLDFVMASHQDSDHIGGMAQVLREVPVERFYQGDLGVEAESQESRALWEALELKGPEQVALARGDSISLGGALLTVLGPFREYEDTNDASLVCRLDYGGFSALFCGDIESGAELDYVKSGEELSADLLKVPHHGSATSCSRRFIQAVSPKYAVVSVGPDRNQLPRAEPLRTLEEAGAEIYRTDTDGTVVFSYDGDSLAVDTEK